MLPDNTPPENQHPSEPVSVALGAALSTSLPPDRWLAHPAIVGVSGGADSVALVRLLIAQRQGAAVSAPLILAHCNYRLRGAESDADEEFVRRLAVDHQLEFRGWRAEVRAEARAKPGGSGWEAAWREQRYRFFTQLAEETGARHLLLAHTADDQVETVLLRLLRGSSLAGLRGIPVWRPLNPQTTVLRPLLRVGRQQLRDYLQEIGQPFRVDSSNESRDFLRNRVRNELLPLLGRDYSPAIRDRLLNLAEEAEETQALLAALARPLLEQFELIAPERLVIPAGVLSGAGLVVVRTALVQAWRQLGWSEQDLTARHWRALAALAAARGEPASALNLPGNRIARRKPDGTILIETGSE